MTDDRPSKRCAPCGRTYRRPPGKTDARWAAQESCGQRSCAAVIREARKGHGVPARTAGPAPEPPPEVTPEPHRCDLAGCEEFVPYRPGEGERLYRRRRYHRDECRNAGRAAAKLAPWRAERRTCAWAKCGEEFTPEDRDQRYHAHPCSLADRAEPRGPRETKVCACPCKETFERPVGMSDASWEKRRFIDVSHRAKGGWLADAAGSRAGNRRPPRITPSKRRRREFAAKPPSPTTEPRRPVFAEPVPAAPWRPPAPTLAERAPTRPRASFGLRRSRPTVPA